MRRLLLLVSVLVAVDTTLYAALTPMLPRFAHELGLGKGQAGVLVAAYAAGALLGAMPGGIAATRLGPRRAVLIGLVCVATASVGFALAGGFWTLFAARLAQGAGSAFTWAGAFAWLLAAAPAQRRGALIGTAMGAAVVGALFGPVVGAAAVAIGRSVMFCVLAGLAAALGLWTVRVPAPPAAIASAVTPARAVRNRTFAGGLALMTLASLLFGILAVLAPLHLSAAGWGASAIGAIWLVGAALEAVEAPLVGRLSDRRGPLHPVRGALASGTLVSLGLATGAGPLLYAPLVLAASVAFGALFTPAFALIADGAEGAGLAQGMAFGLMNAAWAIGAVLGPSMAGAIAGATGDWIPFLIAGAACAGTFAFLSRAPRRDPLYARRRFREV